MNENQSWHDNPEIRAWLETTPAGEARTHTERVGELALSWTVDRREVEITTTANGAIEVHNLSPELADQITKAGSPSADVPGERVIDETPSDRSTCLVCEGEREREQGTERGPWHSEREAEDAARDLEVLRVNDGVRFEPVLNRDGWNLIRFVRCPGCEDQITKTR